MPTLDVAGYLARLDLPDPGPPSMAALCALHRAHLERVPYENLEIQLGRPTTVDPYESADRIVRRRRGGYCFHLNGSFATLLTALGYHVVWHVAGVQGRGWPPPGASGDHLALTVHGLPDDINPTGRWLVDVGLGDAFYEPLPFAFGSYDQRGFRYVLRASKLVPDGWRFDHDARGAFTGFDAAPRPAGPDDFAAKHVELSTSPTSGFVAVAVAQRRDSTGADVLRGCVLSRVEPAAVTTRELTTQQEWYAALADVFGLTLDDVSSQERAALWRRVRAADEQWAANA